MNKRFYKIISFALIIIWMIAIFWLSSMNGEESNYKSKKTIDKALPIAVEISKDTNISLGEKAKIVNKLNGPLRKCMHASVYFVLAILSYNFIFGLKIKNGYLKYVLSLAIVFLYACTDEYHQTFITGRSGEFRDVLIDTSGGIIAIILMFLVTSIVKYIKDKKNVTLNLK